MPTITGENGRLGNQIFRNLAVSLISEKFNLCVNYSSYNLIEQLGINLFIGENNYDNTISLTDDNFFSVFQDTSLNSNVNANNNYFQTKEISNLLYNYLHSNKIKENIINKNPFNCRYNNNDDLFIHIRLTDVANKNPGIAYYLKTISNIQFKELYISSDDIDNIIIKQIIDKYPKVILLHYDEITTFQFSSTCKNIILSHGTFSAIIGYLSFFSNIYYSEYDTNKIWYGDIFTIDGWNKTSISD